MENAADALRMAFAMFVFVLAIGIAFAVFSQARAVADIVLFYTDNTNFEQYTEGGNDTDRIVGLETVVPTIKRYIENNEGYSVKVIISNSKTYTFDLIQDQENNLTPKLIRQNVEDSIKEIIDNYGDVQFEEHFSASIYRGERYNDSGDIIERVNTDEKIEITYRKI